MDNGPKETTMKYLSALHKKIDRGGRFRNCWWLTPLFFALTTIPPLAAQNAVPAGPTSVDPQTLQALVRRIDELEARVRQLEAERQRDPGPSSQSAEPAAPHATAAMASSGSHTPSPASLAGSQADPPQSAAAQTNSAQVTATPSTPAQGNTTQATTPQESTEPNEHAETERMDLSKTLLRIRGYGDMTLHGDNYHPPAPQPADKTAFTLGQLNLFVTSDISDRVRFLSEIVFEGGPDNIYGQVRGTANTFSVDVERYLLQYSYNEYFNLSAGRYHTAIGYYNTAYHHSTWLQTTTGRPLMFAFEDQGGILPIHNVGVEVSGLVPSGPLGLHYVAEVGNGRESRNPIADEPVQNIISDKNHKAVNFELFARPIKVPGLQVGFSAYRDLLVPVGEPAVGETILAAHAIYTKTNFEWLNEAMELRHTPDDGHTFVTPAFYTQISQRFGSYRPYFRYQYINASSENPIFPDIQLRAGPQAGLRYDVNESVALKLQYDYTAMRNQHAVQGLEAQVGFTF
jgi:hypothetical protein